MTSEGRPARTRKLIVETPQGRSGLLAKESRFSFSYETADPSCEVSIVMPLRAESYASGVLFSIFEMNRPEGYLLDRIRARFAKTERLDDMALLRITGAHQIGRLSFREEDRQDTGRKVQVSKRELLSSPSSEELFEFLADVYFDSGISGFQPKVIVPIVEKATLNTEDFIVKASGEDYPHLAQNEFLCMSAARLAGIEVPEFWLSDDGGLFVMARFDVMDGRRLGMEDMCVLMGKGTHEKYLGSYEGIARAIDVFCGDNGDKQRFFEYVAFSCFVRNGDAHLKNFSLLYETPGIGVRLAPLYDVVTTTIYEIVHPRTGMTKVDRTLGLKLAKDKAYPSFETLCRFGRHHCDVRNPETVIERIEDAKRQACREFGDNIDVALLQKLKREWGLEDPRPISRR